MKSEGKNLGGQKYLEKELVERGLSRRRSVQVLNLLLKEMKRALARDEAVVFAGGKLARARKSFGKRWDADDDWPANRQGYTVDLSVVWHSARYADCLPVP